jgi:hypothetical protein
MKKLVIAFVIMAMMITLAPAAFASDDGQAETIDTQIPTAGECMVKYAKKYIGSRYVVGGTHLKNLRKKHDKNRVDCTGFVRGILRKYAKIRISGGSYRKVKRSVLKKGGVVIGKGRKALKKAKPGDIIICKPEKWYRQHFSFYYGKKNGKHMQIDSSPRGHGVNITKIWRKRITVIRLEKKIATKSKKYKAQVADIMAQIEENENEEEPVTVEDVTADNPEDEAADNLSADNIVPEN